MNNFLRFDTFTEANKKATEIFEKEHINVYIFEFSELIYGGIFQNCPYYYVTTNENIVHANNKTIEILKRFNPEN